MENNENKVISPLDVRTKEEHKERLKKWENFGLLNPDIMDYLASLNEEDINAVRNILFSGMDPLTINDNLCIYMAIEGLVTGELEFTYPDSDTDEESCHDPKI